MNQRKVYYRVVLAIGCSLIGLFIWRQLRLTEEAEFNTDAFRTVCSALAHFVKERREWPSSQDQFMDYCSANGLLHGRWLDDSAALRRTSIEYNKPLVDSYSSHGIGSLIRHHEPIYQRNMTLGYEELEEAIRTAARRQPSSP